MTQAKRRFLIVARGYNCEGEAQRTIDSLLEQQYHEFRIIVVDDGSTDATWEELQKYAPDPRVLLFRKQHNTGAAHAVWAALSVADYEDDDIFLEMGLDGDRLLRPDVLMRIVAEYEAGADFTYGNYMFREDDPGWPVGPYPDSVVRGGTYRMAPWRLSPPRTCLCKYLGAVAYDMLMDASGEWYRAATDLALWFPLIEQAHNPVYIGDCLYEYNGFHAGVTRSRYALEKPLWVAEIRARAPLRRAPLDNAEHEAID